MGVIASLKAAGLAGKVKVVGNDGMADAVTALKAGTLSSTNAESPLALGVEVMDLASTVANGQAVDKNNVLQGSVVTAADVASYGTELVALGDVTTCKWQPPVDIGGRLDHRHRVRPDSLGSSAPKVRDPRPWVVFGLAGRSSAVPDRSRHGQEGIRRREEFRECAHRAFRGLTSSQRVDDRLCGQAQRCEECGRLAVASRT